MPAPLVGAAALAAARLLAAQLAKQGVKKTSTKVARAIAKESAGKGAKPPFPTYRKPGRNNVPRLRDTDNTPKKTTVRQMVGPKTKSGKMIEKKYPSKTNTQPPAKKPAKPKAETPRVVKVRGRTIAINKPAANPRVRKREEAQLRIARREYAAERQRQAKLAARRGKNNKVETEELRPAQPTIESRLAARSESIPLTSRNQSGADRMPTSEWRKYAQVRREAAAAEAGKPTRVSRETISRGRARALQPTAERRAAIIKATQDRAIAKAKARGMSDAQIKQMITNARREAAAIAKKAK
jgi:hypothetical protein